MKCQASYAGGCLYCMRCYLQWDANDPEPPECLTDQEVGQRTIERLRKLFNEDRDNGQLHQSGTG